MQEWLRVSSSQPGGHSFRRTDPRATGVPALGFSPAEPIEDRQVRRPGAWSAVRNRSFNVLEKIRRDVSDGRPSARFTPASDAAGQLERRISSLPNSGNGMRASRSEGVSGSGPATDRQLEPNELRLRPRRRARGPWAGRRRSAGARAGATPGESPVERQEEKQEERPG